MKKLVFVVGLGAGYVLGARAGRERYEQITTTAAAIWNDPRVQKGLDEVEVAAATVLPDIPVLLGNGVTAVTRKLFSRSKRTSGGGGRRGRKGGSYSTMRPASPAPADGA
ncbi:YtxH domain-containing protein [Planctomonas psychrotolerans]|uniref:YtxH domain-containing protein n=1 Tax=Planctomonas psychrotolerans TaxID=2528712 RepID=UPI001239497E|nr:YtxH domain-containing protein [Planctomonas psychrotolerans]